MKIIVYVRNNMERAKLSIESILLFVEKAPLIVVDNASEDGFAEWASSQNDFDYVYMDEGYQPVGRVLNQVIDGMGIDEDIMLIDSNCIILPKLIENMMSTFFSDKSLGVVGCYTNFSSELEHRGINNQDAMVDYISSIPACGYTNAYTAMVSGEVCALSIEAYNKVDGFNEELENIDNCIKDYCLRIQQAGYKTIRDRNAVAYDMRNSDEKYSEVDESDILRSNWGIHYLGMNPNMFIVDLIKEPDPNAKLRILEIGCDCGATLVAIKERYPNAQIYGTDINPNSIRVASYLLDDAKVDNIEEYCLSFGENEFDYIIFADVLEHLRNPQGTLEYCKKLLKKNGRILSSIPNLMNISVMRDLLNGNFTYTEVGLLDKTHIHLFTYKEIVRMFDAAGFLIKDIDSISSSIDREADELIEKLLTLATGAQRHMYVTFQYLVTAEKV